MWFMQMTNCTFCIIQLHKLRCQLHKLCTTGHQKCLGCYYANSPFNTTSSALYCPMNHFFHHDLGLKRPTEDLTEAIHYPRLSCSKQLLNDVTVIWFTDKNLFTLATLKIPHNKRLQASAATKKKDVREKTLPSHKNNVQSVAVGVSKLDYAAGLTLVDPKA